MKLKFALGLFFSLFAIMLMREFVTYDVRPAHLVPHTYDVSMTAKDEIIYLGDTSLPPAPGSDVARFGGRIEAERGLFAREGHAVFASALFGVALPLVLFAISVILVGRSQKKSTGR